MTKRRTKLKDLGRQHVKDALIRVHPFLRGEYRELKSDELNSKKVFLELFGEDAEFEPYKLNAVYAFQN